ncbi:MAG: hotdog fold thioesterase [Prevotellaceae bacterium]|nr:hotdog fold thioesterase [Prevotellaceae bacterium]
MEIREMSLEELNEMNKGTLMEALGIRFVSVTAQRVEATMSVDSRTRQPFGILHGGATLALAETVAGIGSYMNIRQGEQSVGAQASCNHLSSALDGDTVSAVATPIHLGRTTHIWNIDVLSSTGRLVSSVRVMNFVKPASSRQK